MRIRSNRNKKGRENIYDSKYNHRKIARICVERDVTEDELNKLKNGENPFQEEMEIELDAGHGDIENDYAVCDEEGRTIIDWSR